MLKSTWAAACALTATVAFVSPALAQEATTPAAGNTEQNTAPPPPPPSPPSDKCESDFCVRDLFVGVGLGLTHNLGGERTEEIEAVDTVDGLFVQIAESQNTDIRVLFETHYLMRGQGIWGDDGGIRHVGDVIPALLLADRSRWCVCPSKIAADVVRSSQSLSRPTLKSQNLAPAGLSGSVATMIVPRTNAIPLRRRHWSHDRSGLAHDRRARRRS